MTLRVVLALLLVAPAVYAESNSDFASRLTRLHQQLSQQRARLRLLREAAREANRQPTSGAMLIHKNAMSDAFKLRSARYLLDGIPVFQRDSELDEDEFEIFNGELPEGPHQLQVRLGYQGHGFGIFTYLEGFQFDMKSSFTFEVKGGQLTVVRITAYEKGDVTTDLKQRPAVRYEVATRPTRASNTPLGTNQPY